LPKMCEKILTGDKYSFHEPSDKNILGTGGNGKVSLIKLIDFPEGPDFAVKLFKYTKTKGNSFIELRYERFRQEIEFLEKHGDTIKGIMPMVDKHLPEKYSAQDPAWFIMPKGNEYDFNARNFEQKLIDFIDLANTLIELHKKGLAHRDIKPENLLLYQNRICLCDFGLLWGFKKERLTYRPDRIGPYKILPPELSPVDPGRNIDYRFSDVYLFAKNLWMILKNNDDGFMGPYLRSRTMYYLRKEEFGAQSLEPIHQLLERATDDEIDHRITMFQCRDLLQQQLKIVRQKEKSDLLSQEQMQHYLYQEATKQVIAQNNTNANEYTEETPITAMLDVLMGNSIMYLQEINGKEIPPIKITAYEPLSEKEYLLHHFDDNQILASYHIYVEKMIYYPSSEEIRFVLTNPPKAYDNDEITLSEGIIKKYQRPQRPTVYRLTNREIVLFQHQ